MSVEDWMSMGSDIVGNYLFAVDGDFSFAQAAWNFPARFPSAGHWLQAPFIS